MILREPPQWNKDAAALLRQFIETPTGQLFLAQIAFRRPNLLSSTDINAVALRAASVHGFEHALQTILSLIEPPVEAERSEPETEAFPDLDDKSAWEKKQ